MTTTPAAEKTFAVRDQRTIKRFWIDDAVYDTYAAQIGIYAYAVYTALVRHANTAQTCFPSYATIAKKLGISKRHVIQEIEKLKSAGLIKASPRQKTGKKGTDSQDSNLYTLLEIGSNNVGVVHDIHYPSACHALPLVHDMHPKEAQKKETQLTAATAQKKHEVAAAAGLSFSESENAILSELKTHGITSNKKTLAIVRKLGQSPHALDIVRTEAKKIADNRQNKAGVLISVLGDYDIATYTPPVKTVIRIEEEY